MQGVKTTGKSQKSLIVELSKRVGYSENKEPELAHYDASTGTYFTANLEVVPIDVLQEAKDHYNSDAVVKRSQAEATLIPGSSALLTKRATFARLAAQALEKEIKSRSNTT